jgi:cell division control protein 6
MVLLSLRQFKALLTRTPFSYSLAVLDEVDHIANSSHVLSAVFSLARRHSSALRIIGIANLPSDETTDVLTLHFGTYTSSQLLEVLRARL